MDSVQHYNQQLVTATAALNNPDMADTDRTAQKGLVANLKLQLSGAQRALQYSSELVHGRVATQTGNAPPSVSTGDRPPLASFGGAQALPNPERRPARGAAARPPWSAQQRSVPVMPDGGEPAASAGAVPFDVAGARAAGYSDGEIANYVGGLTNFNTDASA